MVELIEAMAELKHKQWIEWSKTLVQNETLSPDLVARWEKLWISYEDLDEESKEQDRVYARKALNLLNVRLA